jgi:hypothetical protein
MRDGFSGEYTLPGAYVDGEILECKWLISPAPNHFANGNSTRVEPKAAGIGYLRTTVLSAGR